MTPNNDQQSIALAHLSMIAHAANGKGIVSESGRLSAQIVNNALKLSAQ